MKWSTKRLILLYLGLVIIKSVLSYLIASPGEFSDSYEYMKMARSFFFSQQFLIHGTPSHHYPPLYPMALSLSYIFNNPETVYFVMKIINSILSPLIIFPTYLLAKKFTSSKNSFIISSLVAFLPSNFSFSNYIMSENLLYPVFMFSIYFMYKVLKNKSLIWSVLTGIFIGLSTLTKDLGLVLLPIMFILYILNLFLKRPHNINFNKFFIVIFFFLITISPWLYRNYSFFGLSLFGIMGFYTTTALRFEAQNEFKLINIIVKFFMNVGLLILGSYILPFLKSLNFYKILKDKKDMTLFLTVIIITLAIVSYHGLYASLINISWISGRPMGRYVDILLPLIFIMGIVSFNQKTKIASWIYLSLIPVLIISSPLVLFPLFPVNNLSYSWIGVLKYALDLLFNFKISTVLVLFSLFFLLLYSVSLKLLKIRLEKILSLFIILLFLVNVLNFGITYHNSKTFWYEGEQMQLALKFSEIDKGESKILFDIESCTKDISKLDQSTLCEPSGGSTIMGVWLNNDIKVGSIGDLADVDIVISNRKLNLPVFLRSDNVFIYRVRNN